MKRKFLMTTAGLLAAAMALGACGSAGSTATTAQSAASAAAPQTRLAKSVKTIKVRAFGSTTSLKSFTLQEGIQTMESSIFEYSALTSIYIPKTLSTTDGPFMNSNITDVTFNESLATFTDKLFRTTFTNDGHGVCITCHH